MADWVATAISAALAVGRVFSAFVRKIKAWWKPRQPPRGIKGRSHFGYVDIAFREFRGVKWLLKYPNPRTEREDYLRHLREGVRIDNPSDAAHKLIVKGPYCPKCDTELTESKRLWRFWGQYRWTCENEKCGFKKNSRKSAFEVEGVADKVFESELRKKFETGRKGDL